ncbi:MAG TPA: peptidylprolyl isomerase [Gaiellaceae bacterium]
MLSLTLLAAACGGGSSSGGGSGSLDADDAAVVNGEHITSATLDRRLSEAACSYKLQKRTFPQPGSSEYQSIRSQILQNLVQRAELAQKAPSMGVSVTDKQLEAQLVNLKKQYFGGSEKKYLAELKKQCVTDAEVRADLRANLLSNAIFKKVTADAKVTDADVKAYYETHREVYTTPQTRVVSHILVKKKALADRLYGQLKDGASFAALAKKFSTDPGSKAQGGRLTITRGQTVAPFDKVAFELRTGQLSKPVHTQYGWHIIHADKPATPHRSTPFSQVKASIKQQLVQQKQNTALQAWVNDLKKEYASKVSYAAGLAPAETTTAATTTG